MTRVHRLTSVFMSVVLLAGCAAAPEPATTPREAAAASANRRARELYVRGDIAEARKQAERAFELAASIEDEEGIAASLLNLSVIDQRIGAVKEAKAAVDRILNEESLRFPSIRIAEAALRRAVLALDEGDASAAEKLLDRVTQACGTDCSLRGRVANVRAQLAIDAGRIDDAIAQADAALAVNRAAGEDEEAANALRLGANARILAARYEEADRRLAEALMIDKHLGVSRKIYRDLLLLGISAVKRDDRRAAAAYFQRAEMVARADGYAVGVAEAQSMNRSQSN